MKHDNQTGRWVTPFRPTWGPASDSFVVGNFQKRGVDVFDAASGQHRALLNSPFLTAIPVRMCVHPSRPVLAAGTSSGRMHIWR